MDLAEVVTTQKSYTWKGLKTWSKKNGYLKNKKKLFKIIAIDYGIKKNILRYFSNYNCEVKVINCKTTADEILKLKPHGIFLSNGPGDPAATGKYAIPIIKKLIKSNIPIFGICLGHQKKVEITSQNHGFEVVRESLNKNIIVTHTSLFDNSIEGIKLKNKPVFSVQYHPESNPGPQDSHYLFSDFIKEVKKYAKKKRH